MIPRLIAITPPDFVRSPRYRSAAASAISAGLPAIMLRDKSTIPDEDLAQLLGWLRPLTLEHKCLLIVNRRLELARRIHADGIHLGVGGPSISDVYSVLDDRVLVGWSAHSFGEALKAFEQRADYVTLSPIFETPNKGEPIGLDPLRTLTIQGRPVIALGGITPDRVPSVIEAGAHGVAVIRAIFDHPDPAAAVKAFLQNL